MIVSLCMIISLKRVRIPALYLHVIAGHAARLADSLHSKMVKTSTVLKSLAIAYTIGGLAVTRYYFMSLSGPTLFFIWFTMLVVFLCASVHWAIRYVKEDD